MTPEQQESLRLEYRRAHNALLTFMRSVGLMCLNQKDGNIEIGESLRNEYAQLKAAEDSAWEAYDESGPDIF